MVQLASAERLQALQQALAEATRQSEEAAVRNVALVGELRVALTERDRLEDQLGKLKSPVPI